jgi:hypothetical protein
MYFGCHAHFLMRIGLFTTLMLSFYMSWVHTDLVIFLSIFYN